MKSVPSKVNFAIAVAAMTMVCMISSVYATPASHDTGVHSLKRFQELVPSDNEVVGMTGFYGQDQPDRWLILVKNKESGRYEEHSVNMDGVEGKRQLRVLPGQSLPTIPIDVARLNVDSDMAFQVAETIAFEAKVEYDSVHYQLRSRLANTEPVWMINMLDPDGRSIGVHYISAESGAILRSVWKKRETTSFTHSTQLRYGGPMKDPTPVSLTPDVR